MAISSTFSNFFSFLLPPKPQPIPSPSLTRFPTQNHKLSDNNSVQLVSQQNDHSYSSLSDLSSVMNPSLAHSNTLFFRSAYNVQVVVDENEPEERLLNRFRREVMKAGIIQECKRRRFFENKQEEKKRKTREAAKRKGRSRRPQLRSPMLNKQDVQNTKKEEADDDNWDLPEVDAPYI
ncbi:30S ribosomal protein S21, chloroplastic-like [Abrus precatorius]|uniref:30S ribosomal protein S21, chloroplastic-like n=1 Tax=Abrus precatorius TaxID=3816 RepID=A0A8B8L9V6_ABRPR|nr:30S ribosomal protein S21, chloroplastic-like [Abrus precatorius]